MVRKSHFTLLELMVVLFIISLCVVLTGVKIKDVYQEQRFLSETQQVLSHLSMAQDLMLIMDTDVKVHFAPEKKSGKIEVWMEVEKPIVDAWARLVERKLPLTAIGSIEFDGRSEKELTLQFSLGKMSQGNLILFEGDNSKNKNKKEFEIVLLGYPTPLGNKKAALNERRKSERSEQLYPVEVYEKLYKDANEEKT